MTLFDVSHQECIDQNWLVASLSSCSLAQLTRQERVNAAVWQPNHDSSFVVWEDSQLVGDLVSSDDVDDLEFQVRRSDKKNLLSLLQHSFVTGNSENSSVPHFAEEQRITGSKKDQYSGEDARTSRNDEKKEDQDETKYRGGDARTPRFEGEMKQEQQEAEAQSSFQAVVSHPVVTGLPGHISPLRLSPRGETRSHGQYKICEVFSPPRITPIASRQGFQVTEPAAFDLETGWDFRSGRDRALLWSVLRTQEPDLVVMSPECRPFSVLMNSNWNRMDQHSAKIIQTEGLSMLHFCVQIAEFQISRGRHFLLEHPGGASSWETHALQWLMQQKNVVRFLFDQCAVGLSVVPDTLSRKVTGILTNNLGIAATLSKCQCKCSQPHQQLQHGLPKKAQVYPPGMIHKIIQGIKLQLRDFSPESFVQVDVEEDNIEPEDEDSDEQEETVRPIVETPISSQEKEKIRLLHNNMGHLPKPQMLSLMKAAGGKPQVLKYIKDEFHCHQCMRQQKPISRRKAAFPRVFSFNRIIGVDFIYISWEGKTLAYLNVVCHGTNLQQIGWLKEYDGGSPNSKAAWELFSQLWVRPFGLPEVLISDGGGEFRYEFERSVEQVGILQVISDASSPWQNGRAERHGGWIKTRIEQEIQSGQSIVQSAKELEMLIVSLVSHKNRWFHRGGFSPYQLTFGSNPRIPLELLGDDATHLPAISDVTADSFEQDSAAAEFARSHAIRQKARELCVASTAKDRVRLGSQGPNHKQRQWFPGQWVFVWRRFAGTGQGHVTRSRWSGPGLVLQQSGHTVWVSMRARLLKCNSDQIRSATHEESIGAELLKDGHIKDLVSQTSSHRAGAVDVASEGAPPLEAWDGVPVPDVGSLANALPPHGNRLPPIQEGDESLGDSAHIRQASVTPAVAAAPTTPMIGRGSLIRPAVNDGVGNTGTEANVQAAPLRQISTQTVEEPLVEPTPTERSISSRADSEVSRTEPNATVAQQESKRRKTNSQVQRKVQHFEEVELRRLSRIASQTIRQMDREERDRRNREAASSSTSQIDRRGINRTSDNSREEDIEASLDRNLEADNHLVEHLSFFEIKPDIQGKQLTVQQESSRALRNSEFDMKLATPEEKLGFDESDKKEWDAIIGMKAVQVHVGAAARKIRDEQGHRIITSRMIRRKKPQPGLHNFKYKSRWCVHGHKDPDSHVLQTYSPMPCTESITMFFQTCLNLNLSVSLTDITNAFCQSNKLDRPQGPLFVKPCAGLSLPEDSLIELIAPVYGLDDAPIRWHHTVLQFFQGLGYERSLLEPCWLIKRTASGQVVSQVLIEVDDINIGSTKEYEPIIQEQLRKRFKFGKWETGEADFAGRHVKFLDDKVCMDQEKYILEKLTPYKLPKNRLSDKKAFLTGPDFESFRSLLYRVNWVAHQTRPEVSGVVSLLSSRLRNATVHDLCCLNKAVNHLRSTAQQTLVLHKFQNDKMIFICASDAGGVDSLPVVPSEEVVTDTVQGAWVIVAADRVPSASHKTKVSILSWRSAKLKRRVSSTLAGEALAFSQSLAELEWLQIMFRDACYGDVSRKDWRQAITPFIAVLKEDCDLRGNMQQQCSITDAKSLYDAVSKQNTTSRQDRRTSVELAIIAESMRDSQSTLRWTPHPRMVADTLTKDDLSKSNGALEELLRTGLLSLWDEQSELDARKLDPKNKGRSKKASEKFREHSLNLLSILEQIHINKDLWVLSE